METTLETLTQAHEKTQTMILEQGAQFHDITSELIQTIQGMNK
jgi:DNA-binding protein H-NS